MYLQAKGLKPLSDIQLSDDEKKMLAWIRSAKWTPQPEARDPIPYKAKVPEFFSGVRLYIVQAGKSGTSRNPLDLFIKKIEFQGVISKQEMYPVAKLEGGHFLSMKKADLDNLGVGGEEDDDE